MASSGSRTIHREQRQGESEHKGLCRMSSSSFGRWKRAEHQGQQEEGVQLKEDRPTTAGAAGAKLANGIC
jgi:hypothetical protein